MSGPTPPPASSSTPEATPVLSAKEAKAAAKAAKANRRAAAKGVAPGERQTDVPAGPPSSNTDVGGSTPRQGASGSAADSKKTVTVKTASGSIGAASGSKASGPSKQGSSMTAASLVSATPSLLNPPPLKLPHASPSSAADLISTVHPPPSSRESKAQLLVSSTSRGLHPSVILLMQHLASHTLLGSSARAIATLAALRDFIVHYHTPSGAVLNRDLVTKLGHQISGITSARPLGTSAGNAVRYLKYEISLVPAEMGEREAKAHLVSRIDHFIRDRIIFAARVISSHVGGKIKDSGDVILTFARSSVAEQAIVDAWKKGKRFEVICVGGETFEEGKRLLHSLLCHGIPTSYAPLTSLSSILPRVSLVLLGTASLLANGALYSRAGTATVAMMAHHHKIPVIVCCETFKFSERVRLEGVGGNERADPSPLLPPSSSEEASPTNANANAHANLGALNLLYDLTPPTFITAIASEAGLSGPESVAILLRDYKSILFGT